MSRHEISEAIGWCYDEPYNTDALTNLHRVLYQPLMAILQGMSPDFAADAYQSAFVKYVMLFRSGHRPAGDMEGYFVAVAKNCLIDEIRARRRFVPFDEIFDEDLPTETDEIELADKRIMLVEALNRLNPRCRFLLESYYVKGIEAPVLAADVGINPASIYETLKRCRRQLRDLLGS